MLNANAVETKQGSLILDSHKLSYHYDRVEAWENGEKIAPEMFVHNLAEDGVEEVQIDAHIPNK